MGGGGNNFVSDLFGTRKKTKVESIEDVGILPGIAITEAQRQAELAKGVQTNAAEDLARQRATQERIMSQIFTGQGRKATIATGGQGVTKRAPLLRKTLTGV